MNHIPTNHQLKYISELHPSLRDEAQAFLAESFQTEFARSNAKFEARRQEQWDRDKRTKEMLKQSIVSMVTS